MADDDDQVLVGFIVQRRITKTLPHGRPVGDPLWSIERHYEGEGRRTTLEAHNQEIGDAVLQLRRLIQEMMGESE